MIREIDVVGDLARKSHFVRDEDRRHALLDQLADRHQHFLARLRVERRRHLVEQHHLRPHRKRARNRHSLLLAAGELARIALFLAGETHLGEQRVGAFLDLGLRLLQHVDRRHHHVLERRLVREEVVLLEDDRHILAQRHHFGVLVQRVHGMRADENLASLDRDEAIDATKQRRLSRPRRTDDADGLAFGHRERNPAQHFDRAERLVDIDEADDRFRRRHGVAAGTVTMRGA